MIYFCTQFPLIWLPVLQRCHTVTIFITFNAHKISKTIFVHVLVHHLQNNQMLNYDSSPFITRQSSKYTIHAITILYTQNGLNKICTLLKIYHNTKLQGPTSIDNSVTPTSKDCMALTLPLIDHVITEQFPMLWCTKSFMKTD